MSYPAGTVFRMTYPPRPIAPPAELPQRQVVDWLGPDADTWPEQGVVVRRGNDPAGAPRLEVRLAATGELLGLVDVDPATGEPAVPDRWIMRPVQYRAVIAVDGDQVHSVPMPAGFVPPRPARAADGERLRWRSVPGVEAPDRMRP